MTTAWPEVALGDVCEFKYGKSMPASARSGLGFPVFGSNGEVGRHEDALTSGPTIVVGRKGSFGEVHFSESACWPIDTTYFIDESATSQDLRWLFYLLGTLGLTELNRAAAIPGLNRADAYRKRFPLPPLDEQRRIAAILDKADEVRAKRKAALETLETLSQAIFIEMFGDPHQGWPFKSIGDLADPSQGSIRTGPFGSQLLHSEFVDSGVAVLGIDNAVRDRFAWAKPRFITPLKYEALQRYAVRPGDVLVTIMGTCGRSAVVPDDIPVAINTKHLCCITLDRDECTPEFLAASFRYDENLRRHLGAQAKGAVMPGLNMGLIKGAPLRLPPIKLQVKFKDLLDQVTRIESINNVQSQSEGELFASLQQKAFQGTL